MADDIVMQLNALAATLPRGEGKSTAHGAVHEIERLRAENQVWKGLDKEQRDLLLEGASKLRQADDELERLRSEIYNDEHIRSELVSILHRIANALYNGYPQNELPSWGELPNLVKQLLSAGDELVAAIRNHDLHDSHMKAWEQTRKPEAIVYSFTTTPKKGS